jgi:hypothetical protein
MGYSVSIFLTGHRGDAHEVQNGSLELEMRPTISYGRRSNGADAYRAFERGLSPVLEWWYDVPLCYGIP